MDIWGSLSTTKFYVSIFCVLLTKVNVFNGFFFLPPHLVPNLIFLSLSWHSVIYFRNCVPVFPLFFAPVFSTVHFTLRVLDFTAGACHLRRQPCDSLLM